jgi:hypothetical protein
MTPCSFLFDSHQFRIPRNINKTNNYGITFHLNWNHWTQKISWNWQSRSWLCHNIYFVKRAIGDYGLMILVFFSFVSQKNVRHGNRGETTAFNYIKILQYYNRAFSPISNMFLKCKIAGFLITVFISKDCKLILQSVKKNQYLGKGYVVKHHFQHISAISYCRILM